MAAGITDAQVRAWLRLEPTIDPDLVADVTAATNAWATRLPQLTGSSDDTVDWPVDTIQGLVMLAARLYRRRNSPAGIESAVDQAVYIPRRDGDVDQLLGLGRYQAPAVG